MIDDDALADLEERLEQRQDERMSALARALRRDLRRELRKLGLGNGERIGQADGLTRMLRIAGAVGMVLAGLGALFGPLLAIWFGAHP